MRLSVFVLGIAVLSPLAAQAQAPADPNAPPPPAPPPAPVEAAPPPAAMAPVVVAVPAAPAAPAPPLPKITWGGIIDTYYLYNFLRPDGTNSLLPPAGRAFDTNANSLTLAYAKVSMNAAMDPVAFQLDVGWGTTGTILNAANGTASPAITPGLPVPPQLVFQQAFGTISLPGNLTIDFGKFNTTAGAEVIEANKNWLYSRSFLFNIIPLVHTGVRANLKISDQLTLQASLVNGWNNDPDLNAWKTGGLSAAITINPMVAIFATTYFGKEGVAGTPAGVVTGDTPGDFRVLGDVVVALTLSDKLGINVNVDYIKAHDNIAADYQVGAAAMARLAVNDHLAVALRGEWFRSHVDAGPAAGNADIEEGTLMVALPVGKNFELRPEVRYDHSNDPPAFNGKNGQFTAEVAALTFF
jgi:hypothetical protein